MYCEDSINPGKLNSTGIFKEQAFKKKKKLLHEKFSLIFVFSLILVEASNS